MVRDQPQTPLELVDRLRETAKSASVFSGWASEEDETQAASFLSGLSAGLYTAGLQLSRLLSAEEASE